MSDHLLDAKRSRFTELLHRYKELHGLSKKALAALLGVPVSTLSYWLARQRLPRSHRMQDLCARMGLNHRVLFSDEAFRDWFFDQRVLGLDLLQSRLRELGDEIAGFEVLSLAGVVVLNALLREGLKAELSVNEHYHVALKVKYTLPDTCKYATVKLRRPEGLGYEVLDGDCQLLVPWRYLDERSLGTLITLLES